MVLRLAPKQTTATRRREGMNGEPHMYPTTRTNHRSRKAGRNEWSYLFVERTPKQTTAAVRREGMDGVTYLLTVNQNKPPQP